MRVTLLPRDDAARVITGAVSTLAWAAGAAVILTTIPVLAETLTRAGRADAIALPLTLLVLILAAIIVAMWRMRPVVVIGFLGVAGTLATIYQLALFDMGLALSEESVFLLNRPMLALVTVGVAARTAIGGIVWCVSGYATGWIATFTAAAIAGEPVRPGWGPTITVSLAVVLYLTLFAIQERQRRNFPRFDELEAATKRLAASADLARRTTAVVHDTVLNDLAFVMNAPDTLDERARSQLLADIDTLEDGAWIRATAAIPPSDDEQMRIRNEFTRMASDFRWRGLTVSVTGAGSGTFEYAPGAGDALLGSVRAALENVLKHSGSDSADIEVMYAPTEITFIVSDQGRGFDPEKVDVNRLGIRGSIVGRVEAVGGRVRIWSSPGTGTAVLISVPIGTVVDPGPPYRHQELDYDE